MSRYLALCWAVVGAQYDYVSECPEENGFFADALQCDRYYECKDGVVIAEILPTPVLTPGVAGARGVLP